MSGHIEGVPAMRYLSNRGAIAAAAALFVLCFASCGDDDVLGPGTGKGAAGWTRFPEGADFYGVFGFAADDIFAVADEGDIYRYDGEKWRFMESGSEAALFAVWGSSPGDVWAVGGGGTVLRYDGISWNPVESGTEESLNGVWGSAPDDVFIVGAQGTILHYDGTQLIPMSAGTHAWLTGVWGSSGSDVFVVGWGNTALHYNGSEWNDLSFDGPDLFAVWGRSSTDVWAVGANRVYRYNGSVWAIAFDDVGSLLATSAARNMATTRRGDGMPQQIVGTV